MFLRTLLSLALMACVAAGSSGSAGAYSSVDRDSKFSMEDLYEVLYGALEGGLEHEIELMMACVTDTAGTLGTIDEAIGELEKGDEDSVKKGIELLGQALHEAITVDLRACALAQNDITKIDKAAQTLAHPLSFLYHAGIHIIVNHVEITDEIKTAMDDWSNHDPRLYYDFGFNLGKAMKLVLVGTEELEEFGNSAAAAF